MEFSNQVKKYKAIAVILVLVAAAAGILTYSNGSNSLSNPTFAVSGPIEVGKIYNIGTIISNDDIFPITIRNITLQDSANVEVLNVLATSGVHMFGFEEGYPNWSGVQNASDARLLPGKGVSLGFVIRASKPGKYTLDKLVVEYTYLGLPHRKVIELIGFTFCARNIGEPDVPCK